MWFSKSQIRKCERAHLSAFRAPVPSRMVSNGEYMPCSRRQTKRGWTKRSSAWLMLIPKGVGLQTHPLGHRLNVVRVSTMADRCLLELPATGAAEGKFRLPRTGRSSQIADSWNQFGKTLRDKNRSEQ